MKQFSTNMMWKLILIASAFFFASHLYSQRLAPDKYWIPLADKNYSTYSVSNPSHYLSHPAIARRNRHEVPISLQDIPVSNVYLDSLRSVGLKLLGTSKWFNAAVVQAEQIEMIYDALKFSFVLPFDPQSAYQAFSGTASHTDSVETSKSEIKNKFIDTDYGKALKQLSILGGGGLHALGYKGRGMKIAVLDAGFYRVDTLEAFRSLREDGRILGYRDFVNSEDNFFNQSAHGMSVLSTMAANLPGTMIGTAPEASYWLLRTEDSGSEFKIEEANWVMAAEFADSAGVDIITSSLGYNTFNDSLMDYTYEDMNGLRSISTRAADIAFEKGMIVIVSAGNEGNKTWGKITAPSDAFHALSIGAIDTSGNMAAFSSRGPSFDGRVKPDILAVGALTTIINSFGSTSMGYGTSYAAPQIAGLIACLWQAQSEKKNYEITQAVKESADSYNFPGFERGYGVPDFMHALKKMKWVETVDLRIQITPNPFRYSFNVVFDIEVNEIQILDQFGRLINSFSTNLQPYQEETITPSGLTPGVYMLRGRNQHQSRTSRLIKQ